MKRATLKKSTTVAMIALMSVAISSPLTQAQTNNSRIAGQDRYQTARLIGESFNNGQYKGGVILASGRDFSDALSATALSKKINAPILLVDIDVKHSLEAMNYIHQHVPTSSPIYIIGGTSIIGSDFETSLNKSGYYNLKRLAGQNQFDTDIAVVNEVNAPLGTPVFLASGENFQDALSVSSFSGAKQYPTLLIESDSLPARTEDYLTTHKPATVYIAGGLGVISQAVESRIKAIQPNATIIRLAGNNQYDTASTVAAEFAPTPQTIYLANGSSFPDALAGSALAAKTGDPILLLDQSLTTLPQAVIDYLQNLRSAAIRPNVKALGGIAVVSDSLLAQVENMLDGQINSGDPITQQAVIKATIAVEKAEESESQSDVNAAKISVKALPNGGDKTSLSTRLEEVQRTIDDKDKSRYAVSDAKDAVKKAENSQLQSDVTIAKSLVRELPDDSTKASLLKRLNTVQNTINDIKDATTAVEQAEITQTPESIDLAGKLVEDLPEGTEKYALLKRLEAIEY